MRILISQKSGDGAPPLHDARRAELRLTKQEFLVPHLEPDDAIRQWYEEGTEHHHGVKGCLVRKREEVKSEWFIDVEDLDELRILATYFGPFTMEETDYLEAPLLITLQEW